MLVNEAEQVRCGTQELREPINIHQRGSVGVVARWYARKEGGGAELREGAWTA